MTRIGFGHGRRSENIRVRDTVKILGSGENPPVLVGLLRLLADLKSARDAPRFFNWEPLGK